LARERNQHVESHVAVALIASAIFGQCAYASQQEDMAQTAQSQYCALRVQITRSNGDPFEAVAGVPLKIVDSRTQRALVSLRAKGISEYCNLSTDEPFDVAVGGDGCGQVVVKNLQVLWGGTVDIKIIYKPCFEMGEELPWYGCKVLFRVRDEKNQPVVTATVTQNGRTERVDSVGRWITWLHMDEGPLA
jgi:hypothetical protein